MTEEERIFKGMLFASEEAELIEKKLKAHRLSQEYNLLFEEENEKRNHILKDLLAIVHLCSDLSTSTMVVTQKSAHIAS